MKKVPGLRIAVTLLAAGAVTAGCEEERRPPASTTRVVALSGLPKVAPKLKHLDPLRPQLSGKIDLKLVPECSGFAASKKYPGVFWTLSDSASKKEEDRARLVAIGADGATVPNPAGKKFAGISVAGVPNVDWESLAIDESGRLIIGDFGNNASYRNDLCFYILPSEPDPASAGPTPKPKRLPFFYADQTAFPDPKKNHDGEAMFVRDGEIYVLTKEWGDTGSVLHRIDRTAGENAPKPTIPVCRFESHGMVTDAGVSPDGKRLAILTYTGVWVFALPAPGAGHPLSGKALYRPLAFPLTSWQVEAIAFIDNDTLLIGNEEGDLYRVKVSSLSPVD